ncbi:SCO2400 family protein, partial [Streptomyces recifensis]|uniref:SCO2400 family protein n=1 Tax=Streptomyces recifensis TaxID=67355 RepID=UPI003CC63C34
MDYCHPCRRHLNGALACPGCGAPALTAVAPTAAVASGGMADPYGQSPQAPSYGETAHAAPYGQEAVAAPYGQEALAAPYGEDHPATPYGQETPA